MVRVPRPVPRLRPRSRQLRLNPAVLRHPRPAYPLFLYSFIVAIIHNVRSDSSSSALGWFWAVHSVGIGVFGSYIPSFTIPHIGEMGTPVAVIVAIIHNVRSDSSSSALGWFWAVYSVGIGVFGSYIPSFTIPHIGEIHHSAHWRDGPLWLARVLCHRRAELRALRNTETPRHMQNLTTREVLRAGPRGDLIYTNRSIMLSSIVRIINTLSLFGFAVVMPMMFVDELGFTTSEWLQVWAAFFTTIFSNVFWGIVAEKLGWMKVVRWFGCIGMAPSSFYPAAALRP